MNFFSDFRGIDQKYVRISLLKNRKTLIITLIVLVFIILRLKVHHSPIDSDEGHFGFLARQLISGKILYKDYHVNRPPGGIYTYALFFKLFGDSVYTIKLIGTVFLLASSYFLFKIANKLFSTNIAIISLALFYLTTLIPSYLYNRTLVEPMMTFFILISIWKLIMNKKKLTSVFISGFFMGISMLFHILALPSFFAVLIWLFISSKNFIKKGIIFSMGFIIPILFILTTFIFQDNLNDYIFSNFIFNFSYMETVSLPIRLLIFPFVILFENPFLWVFGVLGGLTTLRTIGKKDNPKILLSLQIFIPFIFIQFLGRDAAYHYSQIVPFLVVLSTYFVKRVFEERKNSIGMLITLLLFLLPVLVVLRQVVFVPAKAIVLSACRGTCGEIDYFSEDAAKRLEEYLDAGDYIYVLGKEAQFYYYTNTVPSSKYLIVSNLIYHQNLMEIYCENLVRNKPKLIINTMLSQYSKRMTEDLVRITESCLDQEIEVKEQIYFAEVWFLK